MFLRQIDFFTHHLFVANAAGEPQRLDIPSDAYTSVARNWLELNLRSDWSVGGATYRAGAMLVIDLDAFMAGARDFTVLFTPTKTAFLQGSSTSGDAIALNILDNVRSRIQIARFADNRWQIEPVAGFPELATLDISALDTDDSDD
jgi:prolyl oligopeptidase